MKKSPLLKQKELFEELTNERVDEIQKIQNLSKQIDFNNSIYDLRLKVAQKCLSILNLH